MTIEEYKSKFIALFEQMEAEHGNVDEVKIYTQTCRYTICDEFGNDEETYTKCKITFS